LIKIFLLHTEEETGKFEKNSPEQVLLKLKKMENS